jgi:hypothetical protein
MTFLEFLDKHFGLLVFLFVCFGSPIVIVRSRR